MTTTTPRRRGAAVEGRAITKKAAATVKGPDLMAEVERLRQQVRDIDDTITELVGQYGSDWCADGRQEVNEALMKVGLSPIALNYSYVVFRTDDSFHYQRLRASTPEAVALRDGLKSIGLYVVGSDFDSDLSFVVDGEGDRV
jgi:hypothetical protein